MKKIAVTNRYKNTYMFYKRAIEKVGGKAIELEKIISDLDVKSVLESFDALVMTGGGDVSPDLYGEQLTYSKNVVIDRDMTEIVLAKYAYENNIPTLAICRGMQVTNVAFNGTLFQDNILDGGFINHALGDRKYEKVHEITTLKGSKVYDLLGENLGVNSSHHQSVKKVADRFIATSFAKDGCVESMEGKNGKFICVQWHPERLCLVDENQYSLFDTIVNDKL